MTFIREEGIFKCLGQKVERTKRRPAKHSKGGRHGQETRLVRAGGLKGHIKAMSTGTVVGVGYKGTSGHKWVRISGEITRDIRQERMEALGREVTVKQESRSTTIPKQPSP